MTRLPGLIEGEGILLRLWTPGDAEALARAIEESAEHLRPWMAWIADEPLPLPRRVGMLEQWDRDWRAGGDAYYGIFVGGQIAGACGLHHRRGPGVLEIGYWTHPSFLRRGIATTASGLLTEAALAQPGIATVEIHHDKANVASAGVPQKLGYRFVGETADGKQASAELGVDWGWRKTATPGRPGRDSLARMGERTQHAPGTFSWVDLSTTDQDGAKAFYAGLFGWQAQDLPVDENTIYSMQLVDGKPVAAISPQPQQQREAGVPPVWNSYVTVESADASADKASELGGTVHAPPFDVMDAGRMAVVQDPGGAFFMVWEPKENIGAGLVNAPGALCWNELATPDIDAAQAFYGGLFGWTFSPFEGEQPYFTIQNGEKTNGGMRAPQPGEPPNWLVYFATEDTDASVAKVEELGGTKMIEPFDFPMGRIGIVADPQNAAFALYAGQLEP